MKKQNKKSLALSKETIRTLGDEVRGVAGAGQTAPVSQCNCPSWDKECHSFQPGCTGGGTHTLQ